MIFSRYMPISGIAGSGGVFSNPVFIFFKESPYCSPYGVTNLDFLQQGGGGSLSIFLIGYGNIFMMVALKFLSVNSGIWNYLTCCHLLIVFLIQLRFFLGLGLTSVFHLHSAHLGAIL